VAPEEREFDKDWAKGLDLKNGMRYFSGKEMAGLFDFSENFSFPVECTLKQQWKLLGNSLNVRVAARMSELGIRLLLSKHK
jgi:tRNA (cytosine38-C5)-methyltransferase